MTNGPLTPMPSLKLELGRYVTLRPRKDGTTRVLLEVPVRLRPSGWLAAIPLPIDGARTGDLNNLEEVSRIQADAAALYKALIRARAGMETHAPARLDMAALNREWQNSQYFKGKSPRTQQGYAYHAGLLETWAKASGNKPVASLTREAIEAYLALYDDRPTTRRHVKTVLKMLLDYAVALKWRTDNPAEGIKVFAPKTRLRIWERADVEAGAWACVMANQSAVAAMILAEWEIGQRVTDLRLFRWGAEYQPQDGAFRFWQSKTDSYVTIPVSNALRALLEAVRDPESLYLFVDRRTRKPFAEQRLSHVWSAIRLDAGLDKRLQIRTLRHSCVVQLARAGEDIPGIASVTGHSPFSAAQILAKYLPRDNEVAWNAQRKRGLIGADRERTSDGHPNEKYDGPAAGAASV